MIYVHWLIITVYVLAVVGTVARVLLDNRQPAKTMAWVMVLFFVPVVGIILYFFFGQNTRKERLISQQSLNQLAKRSMFEYEEQADLQVPEEYRALLSLFMKQNGAMPFKDNQVDIFTDGYAFFHSLLRDMAGARHHIHIDSYIFNDDALGNLIADALISHARRGVEVRVIYDDVGNWKVKTDFYERMRDAGVEVHAFMPVKFPAFTSKVNYRNHRKMCVIDGHTGYIGGMNIATRYVQGKWKTQGGTRRGQSWRDTHLRIRGGAVYGIQRAFLIDWYFVDRTLITSRRYYPDFTPGTGDEGRPLTVPRNQCLIQIVTSSPIAPWPVIMQGYVRILTDARRYVYMETPYFLPTEPVLFAMRTAALAGVDVRLMIPYKTDARLVEWASRSYVRETLEAGVKVYLYHAGFNHSKLLVCDDELCSCGSSNIDFRSFENNFESNAFIYDHAMAMRMKAVFLEDQSQSHLLSDGENLRRPLHERLWESVVRLFSPLL
ncbi:MAG: cardiolipin synthase [Prevotella sp.]|nr:cardiolipin synthase [Prevotella sp.]